MKLLTYDHLHQCDNCGEGLCICCLDHFNACNQVIATVPMFITGRLVFKMWTIAVAPVAITMILEVIMIRSFRSSYSCIFVALFLALLFELDFLLPSEMYLYLPLQTSASQQPLENSCSFNMSVSTTLCFSVYLPLWALDWTRKTCLQSSSPLGIPRQWHQDPFWMYLSIWVWQSRKTSNFMQFSLNFDQSHF